MKSIGLGLVVVLMSLSTTAVAQPDAEYSSAAPVPSPERESFAAMKALAGEWEGPVTITKMPEMTTRLHASIRVTSRGNAIVHEFQEAGTPLDATKYDHPVTMIYLDEDEQLTLVHYCDAGNRPRMLGTMSPDGKTFDFEFVDINGSVDYHMHHGQFHIIDANHHTEDWTFMMKDKPVHAHMDLVRVE